MRPEKPRSVDPRDAEPGPVFKVERGCPANRQGVGCGCTGQCHELVDVVLASEYFKLLGRSEERLVLHDA